MLSGLFSKNVPMFNSTKSFNVSKLHALILDMDGVLWRDKTLLGDLPSIFNTIDDLGLQVIMATNNASRSPAQYVDKLAHFGVKIESWQVITSADATAYYLKNQFPEGGDVYIVGEESLKKTITTFGFNPDGNHPVAVVAGLDRGINYQKMTEATLLIRKGVPFIGTNPDKSFPILEGEAPGAGAFLAALEAATGVSPVIIGKPEPIMFKLALERLAVTPEETLVVGDRLETDIQGAQNAGCFSALVLSGVTTSESAKLWQPPPQIISPDMTSLLAKLAMERNAI
jgi:4-nitrophenyl phosphatase